MKKKLILFCIYLMKAALRIIYSALKLLPIKQNKVLFCSRQANEPSLDFLLLQKFLRKQFPEIQCIVICNYIETNLNSYVSFAKDSLRSMYHLATSKVCVLDSYWPVVSLLNHKQELTVIQIWHAIGKIKQSGKIAIGAVSGRNAAYAEALNMHGNYDHIIAGAKFWNRFYCESFGIDDETILLNYGLPRIDYLLDTEEQNRNRFFRENPMLQDKTILLYAPTFRRNMELRWKQIIDATADDNYILIIKGHPIQKLEVDNMYPHVYKFDEWRTIDLISVCDYVITDYSAIALEAAVLKKRTYYWTYDYEAYLENNGLNIDLKTLMPEHVFADINVLMSNLKKGNYHDDLLYAYRKQFLPDDLGHSTEKIGSLILGAMKCGGE